MALEKIDIETLDPKRTIVVATGNAHKLTEIEAILSQVLPDVRFVALGQLGDSGLARRSVCGTRSAGRFRRP